LRTTEQSSQPTPFLAETWELPSLSRLACIPYYEHIGCKIIQCPRTPPLLDVRPRGRKQDKPCITVLPLASSSGTRKHAAFTSWDPGPRVGTPTVAHLRAGCAALSFVLTGLTGQWTGLTGGWLGQVAPV